MHWSAMDALHHIFAAAVLFALSWVIEAWQTRQADSLDSSKAIYQTLEDGPAPQVSHHSASR